MRQQIPAARTIPADTSFETNSLRTLARWLLRAPRKQTSGKAARRTDVQQSDAQNRLDSLPESEALLLPEVPGRTCKRVRK